MNELIPTQQNDNGEILVTGRDLHEFLEVGTEYRHWIKRMIEYGFEENMDYVIFTENVGGQKRTRTYTQYSHHMKLDMAKEISMIQRNEKGKQARQYFLHLERLWNSPEAVMKRALEYADKKMVELQSQIEIQKPKVLYADAVSLSEDTVLIKDLAAVLKQEGINIGSNRLFKWMRENGFLCKKKGEMWNMPTQRSLDLKIMAIKHGLYSDSNGEMKKTRTPKVTGKGQVYFINKFIGEKEVVS